MARARELAEQMMENSPTSLYATKRLLSDIARAELDRADGSGGARERRHPNHR